MHICKWMFEKMQKIINKTPDSIVKSHKIHEYFKQIIANNWPLKHILMMSLTLIVGINYFSQFQTKYLVRSLMQAEIYFKIIGFSNCSMILTLVAVIPNQIMIK